MTCLTIGIHTVTHVMHQHSHTHPDTPRTTAPLVRATPNLVRAPSIRRASTPARRPAGPHTSSIFSSNLSIFDALRRITYCMWFEVQNDLRQAEKVRDITPCRGLAAAHAAGSVKGDTLDRRQVLTLVHFSAQHEPFLSRKVPNTPNVSLKKCSR